MADQDTSLPGPANAADLKVKNDLVISINALTSLFGSGFIDTLQTALDQIGDVQGDVLYHSSTAWAALAPGTSGQFLQTLGAAANPAWGDAIVKVALQVFTGSGTYTPTTGMLYTLLGTIGGGAGGGGAASAGAGGMSGGGGGGGGSTSLALKTAAQVGSSQAVTIGGTANGGTAGNNDGTDGNDTSIGSLCIGKGGTKGGGAASNASGSAGAGGVAGTGTITIIGGSGERGQSATILTVAATLGGKGGNSGLGFGAGGRGVTGAGTAGSVYGGGGSGAGSSAAGGDAAGGNGAAGFAFTLDFCKV